MTDRDGAARMRPTLPILFVLAALATFVALGTWQVERKAWKEALIASLDARLSALATPLPPAEAWRTLDRTDNEFRQVRFSAAYATGTPALVFTSGSALRNDVLGPGYWVFALARLPEGEFVVINRGFTPQHAKGLRIAEASDSTGSIEMTGVMRWPEPRGYFTPEDDPARNLWFVRDHLAIAAGKGWSARESEIAPFFIDLEGPVPASGWPRPGPLKVNIRNEHLQYAITWYGLAAAVAVMFAVWLMNQRRPDQRTPA
jgi:cytochrome oxidase assembly protein ShyY1